METMRQNDSGAKAGLADTVPRQNFSGVTMEQENLPATLTFFEESAVTFLRNPCLHPPDPKQQCKGQGA